MKKVCLIGIAALLALAVFSCNSPSTPEDVGGGGIALFGPELTTGRALVGATSEAGTNYYEATFQRMDTAGTVPATPSKIARTKWGYARKGPIQPCLALEEHQVLSVLTS